MCGLNNITIVNNKAFKQIVFEGFIAYNFGMKSIKFTSRIRYRNIEKFVKVADEIYKNIFPPRGY